MEVEAGASLPKTFIDEYRRELGIVVERELREIPGTGQALEQIDLPKCVASNGPRDKIERALSVTNLSRFFEGFVFSAYDIGAWKPEPDLFLHVAGKMNTDAIACAVIEDSTPGIQAAQAAGMQVIVYDPAGNELIDARTIKSMDQLPSVLLSRP